MVYQSFRSLGRYGIPISRFIKMDVDQEIGANEIVEAEDQDDSISNSCGTKFPVSRVKKIMKADPELTLVNHDAIFLISKATENFIGNLVTEAFKYTAAANKKTLSKRDLDSCIENIDALVFLDGTLDS